MSKSCCFAVVLAVICLPVILLSLEADAQPTVDETATCGSSTPGEVVNMFKIIASSQQENAKKINDVKELLESKTVDCDAAQPSKQPLVSALVCEFLVSVAFNFTELVRNQRTNISDLMLGYWTTRGYANSRIANSRTGHLADWTTRGYRLCGHAESLA